MSTLATTNIKHPSSASNNVVLDSGGGATFGQIKGGAITSGTAVASTSGTSIDFTSIPSWVKRITVMFSGVSTNGTSYPQIQLGAGSVTTSGYLWRGAYVAGASVAGTSYTSGFGIRQDDASGIFSGSMVLTTLDWDIVRRFYNFCLRFYWWRWNNPLRHLRSCPHHHRERHRYL